MAPTVVTSSIYSEPLTTLITDCRVVPMVVNPPITTAAISAAMMPYSRAVTPRRFFDAETHAVLKGIKGAVDPEGIFLANHPV